MIERLRRVGLDSWLAAVAGAILILLIVQLVRYARAGTLGEEIVRASQLQPVSQGRSDVKAQEEYKPLLEEGHFGKKKKGPSKPPQLCGILGKVALLGNSPDDAKPYEVGAKLSDGSKLAEIHLDFVVTEKDGKKQTIAMFPELGAKEEAPPRPSQPPQPQPSPDQKPVEGPPEAGSATEQSTPEAAEEQPPEEQERRPRMRRERPSAAEMRERIIRMRGRSRGTRGTRGTGPDEPE